MEKTVDKLTKGDMLEVFRNSGIKIPDRNYKKEELRKLLDEHGITTYVTNAVLEARKLKNEPIKTEQLETSTNNKYKLPIDDFSGRIFHISDIHIRNNDREDEYNSVLVRLIKTIKSMKRDGDLIVISGDLIHNVRDIRPIVYRAVTSAIEHLRALAPILIIAGNHDLSDQNGVDAIEGILGRTKNVYYLNKTGTYTIGSLNTTNFDVYALNDGLTINHDVNSNIEFAIYHGSSVSKIKGPYKYVLLGDIHTMKIWKTQNPNSMTFGYAGSLIQQDFSEGTEHGFLFWTHGVPQFIPIINDYLHYTITIGTGNLDEILENAKRETSGKKIYLRIIDHGEKDIDRIIETLKPVRIVKKTVLSKRELSGFSVIDLGKKYGVTRNMMVKNGVISDELYITLGSVSLRNTFGIRNFECTFSDGLTVISGDNGVGKTSLIKAIDLALLYEKKGMTGVSTVDASCGYKIILTGNTIKNGETISWPFKIDRECTNITRRVFAMNSSFPGIPNEYRNILRLNMISSFDYENFENLSKGDQRNVLYTLGDFKRLQTLKSELEIRGIDMSEESIESVQELKFNIEEQEKVNKMHSDILHLKGKLRGKYRDGILELERCDGFSHDELVFKKLIDSFGQLPRTTAKIMLEVAEINSKLEDLPDYSKIPRVTKIIGSTAGTADTIGITFPSTFKYISYNGPFTSVPLKEDSNIDEIFDHTIKSKWRHYLNSISSEVSKYWDLHDRREMLKHELENSKNYNFYQEKYTAAVNSNMELREEIINYDMKVLNEIKVIEDELCGREKKDITAERIRLSKYETPQEGIENSVGLLNFIEEYEKILRLSLISDLLTMINRFYEEVCAPFKLRFYEGVATFQMCGGDFDHKYFSKSEKVVASLGIKYAMNLYSKYKIDTIFVDETLDSLDLQSTIKIEKIIELLLTSYKKVIVVSHRPLIASTNTIRM